MLIIIDNTIPEQAKKKLSTFGEIMELQTSGITYDAISGHPDIFFCKTPKGLIVAQNTPAMYIELLKGRKVSFNMGEKELGLQYPESSVYNAVVTDKYCIHNQNITDPEILRSMQDHQQIHVNQGYTRCSLLPLKNDHFITSDTGIYQVLTSKEIDVLSVNPVGIRIQGLKHGFFGGTCGIYQDKVFIIGSLAHFDEGEKVRVYLEKLEYEIIELYDGPLFDGGSIIF